MGVGTSLVLIAIGAILRFAVTVSTHGFNIHTIGVILMVVGVIGLIITLLWMTMWRDRYASRRRGYVERDVPRTRTRTY
jgi:sulfite exporter TauE/SafE